MSRPFSQPGPSASSRKLAHLFVCLVLLCVSVCGFVHMSAGAPGGQNGVSNPPKAEVSRANVGAGNQTQVLDKEQQVSLTFAPCGLQTWFCLLVETESHAAARLALNSRQPFCISLPRRR